MKSFKRYFLERWVNFFDNTDVYMFDISPTDIRNSLHSYHFVYCGILQYKNKFIPVLWTPKKITKFSDMLDNIKEKMKKKENINEQELEFVSFIIYTKKERKLQYKFTNNINRNSSFNKIFDEIISSFKRVDPILKEIKINGDK